MQDLLKQKKIQNSELFGAFLMGSTDPSLFSPESVGGKIYMKIKFSHQPFSGQISNVSCWSDTFSKLMHI